MYDYNIRHYDFSKYYGPNFINNCIEKMRDIYHTEQRETFKEEEEDLAFIYFVQRNYGDNTTLKDYLFGHKPPAYLSKVFFLHHPPPFYIINEKSLLIKDIFLDSPFASLHIPQITIKSIDNKVYYETFNKQGESALFEIKGGRSSFDKKKKEFLYFMEDTLDYTKLYRHIPIQPLHLPPLLIKPNPLYI